jgi:tetratricopeptide (TPR) repeat protein
MLTPTAAALLAALAVLATPEKAQKQSWESAVKPEANAFFWPRAARVEVDGKVAGQGSLTLETADPQRSFRIKVSAPGFEAEEATVQAARIANGQFYLALRPAGFGQRLDPLDPSAMALAASALWKAGRRGDAAEYAEQSLSRGNTPLANRILGDYWKGRGDRDKAVRYYTMYLSLASAPADGPEIRQWLMQDRPGDITIPER